MKNEKFENDLGVHSQHEDQLLHLKKIKLPAAAFAAITLTGWPTLSSAIIAQTSVGGAERSGIDGKVGAVIIMQGLHAPSAAESEMSTRIQRLLTTHQQQLQSQQQDIHQQIASLQQQNTEVKQETKWAARAIKQTATERLTEKMNTEKAAAEKTKRQAEATAAERAKQQAAAAAKAAKKAEILRQVQEINQAIAQLQRLQQEAMAEVQQAHEIITTQPNCQKFITTRGWHNPCEYRRPGYHRVHYADQQRKITEDDVYLCTKAAEPRESTQCLLTHILTDRNRNYIAPEHFTIPKRVRAHAIIKDFWRSSHICITIHNKTRNEDVVRNRCFSENSQFPLPYSDNVDQQFVLSFADNNGENMGGVYIASQNVNIDRTPLERAQQKMRQVIADTEPKIAELTTRKDHLTEELSRL